MDHHVPQSAKMEYITLFVCSLSALFHAFGFVCSFPTMIKILGLPVPHFCDVSPCYPIGLIEHAWMRLGGKMSSFPIVRRGCSAVSVMGCGMDTPPILYIPKGRDEWTFTFEDAMVALSAVACMDAQWRNGIGVIISLALACGDFSILATFFMLSIGLIVLNKLIRLRSFLYVLSRMSPMELDMYHIRLERINMPVYRSWLRTLLAIEPFQIPLSKHVMMALLEREIKRKDAQLS